MTTALSESGEAKEVPNNCKILILTGNLKQEDFDYIRANAIKKVDLSGVTNEYIGNDDQVNMIYKRFWDDRDCDGSETKMLFASNSFSNCLYLKKVILPAKLKSLKNGAFYLCSSLKKIIIPEYVDVIGKYAFHECSSLTTITIPKSVKKIDVSAFQHCFALESVVFSSESSITAFADSVFSNCTNLKSFSLKCHNITEKEIEWQCNDGSKDPDISGIEEQSEVLDFPKKIVKIGFKAFYDCRSIKNINLPADIEYIEKYAFSGCSSMKKITMPSGLSFIGQGVFENCRSLTNVILPAEMKAIPNMLFYHCNSLEEIEIPCGAKTIGASAFAICRGLKKIKLPKSVTRIENGAFDLCVSLKTVEIYDTLSYIGESAFQNCISLNSIKSIRNEGEKQGNNTEENGEDDGLDITKGKTEDFAFKGCKVLSYFEIPAKITTLKKTAFMNCGSLSTVRMRYNSDDKNICEQMNCFGSANTFVGLQRDKACEVYDGIYRNAKIYIKECEIANKKFTISLNCIQSYKF